jgi:hypothetical protein
MFEVIIITACFVLVYGLVWHDQPAGKSGDE